MPPIRPILLGTAAVLVALTARAVSQPAPPPAPNVRLGTDAAPADAAPASESLDEVEIVGRRLDAARQRIQPSLGATRYDFSHAALEAIPQAGQSSLQQVLLQAPGVATDSFGQIHLRDEHANVQYRLDGVQLPEGLSVFGQALGARFAHSVSLITGALPAQYGFNQAGVVNITTKSGITDPGGAITMYGGIGGLLQPSFEYGGRAGAIDYFVTGDYLHTSVGIENPANTANPLHDRSDQFRGLAHISGLIDGDTIVSLLGGTFDGAYQIPNRPGQQPGLGLSVDGQTAFDSANLNERQREQSQFAILSLQKHFDGVDVQISVFSRASKLSYSPDPLGDLLFTGIAQTAERSSWASGAQTDASWQVNDAHTLRAGFLAQVERSVAETNSLVLPVDAGGAQTSDTPFQVEDNSGHAGTRAGLYLQDEWKISPAVTINYGSRFDVVNEYIHDQDASPRVNIVWKASATTTLHGGYARYFTPPPFELVGNETITRFLNTTGAPSVTRDSTTKAERAHYFDAGISQTLLPGLSVGVDAYYKISHNLIDEGQFGSPVLLTAFNYAHGRQQGVEWSASYDRGPWSLYGNLAWSRGVGKGITSAQFNFAPDELAYIATHYIHLDHDQRWTGSGGAAYTIARDSDHPTRLSADLLVESGLRASASDIPNGGALPGYYVINLAAVQTVRLVPTGSTEFRLDILNLLDRRYEIRDGTGVGVGAPQYGLRRTILAGLTQRF